MNLLLDTCALIWAITDPQQLTKKAISALQDRRSQTYVSAISCGEMACLAGKGRIAVDRHWKVWFNHYIKLNQWPCLDISLDIIQEAYCLPDDFHQDPADRIIVATARLNKMTIVTADQKILNYPHCDTLWE